MRSTYTYTTADAIICFDCEGIDEIYIQDFSITTEADAPPPVKAEFGSHWRVFKTVSEASLFLFEIGAVFGETHLLNLDSVR